MKSKRGWVAIIEMCMAIVILFSFFILAFDNPLKQDTKDYSGVGEEILFQVENSSALREKILADNLLDVEALLRDDVKSVDSSVNLAVCITEMDSLCSSDSVPPKKEVSAYDFFVNGDVEGSFGSKKLKVFLWSE
jgi:hypothetical protein